MDVNAVDLASFDLRDGSNDGAEFEILHPVTGAKTGSFITVLGFDSKVAKQLRDAQLLKAQRTMQRTGRIHFESPQGTKDQRIDFCVACTKSWRNMVYKGAVLEFSPANARMLYGEVEAVLEQVDLEIANKANFLKG